MHDGGVDIDEGLVQREPPDLADLPVSRVER
jgi:hypothetical protein